MPILLMNTRPLEESAEYFYVSSGENMQIMAKIK